MGITPGAIVQVIEAYNPGPVIVNISGTRFAVGWGYGLENPCKEALGFLGWLKWQ
ncbi:FeoA family protein [Thermococcus peptonophilus]|uniref:FeoA family protein n=1 Tax=Thermococcus peptonophilus TaxID=53952 RepID=UPI0034672104